MRTFKVKLELDGGWAFLQVTAVNLEDAMFKAEEKFKATHANSVFSIGLKAVAVHAEPGTLIT